MIACSEALGQQKPQQVMRHPVGKPPGSSCDFLDLHPKPAFLAVLVFGRMNSSFPARVAWAAAACLRSI
jgi:hypothetical protein